MNKLPVKVVSAVLVASMALSFGACTKKGGNGKSGSRSGKKITADMPWYDGTSTTVKLDIKDDREVEYTYSRLAGIDDDYIVVFTNGSYKMPDSNKINWDTFNYNDYAIYYVTVIDRKTNETLNSIDLGGEMAKNAYIDGASYANGVITVTNSVYDEFTYQVTSTETDIDPLSGNKLGSRETELEQGESSNVERTFQLTNCKIDSSINWDNNDNAYYNLYVYSEGGEKTKVKVKSEDQNIYDISAIIQLSEDSALVLASGESSSVYFELDLKTYEIKEVDGKEYDWIDTSYMYSSYTGKDGKLYYIGSTGISCLDVKAKTTEEICNFSWCTISRNTLNYLSLIECSEDSMILAGEEYKNNPFSNSNSNDFVIVELHKVPNPHAGKTILEVYSSYGYVEEKLGEAIVQFNDTNGDYFIEVTDRYQDDSDYDYDEINSEDDWEGVSLKANANMSNRLAMDILNGEGPDILLNVSDLGQLNSPTYLADLTPYIGTLDSGKYFTNVIEAAKVDGKLYNLPVCYLVSGINTDASNAGASGIGFTTEEYEKFLKDTLNGKDVINLGQANYFAKLFSSMSDKFIKNGKIDFSAPEFAQLAEFVKNNVNEKGLTYDEMYPDDEAYAYGVGATLFKGDVAYGQEDEAIYASCYGFTGYMLNMVQLKGKNPTILGLPSTDGRGPMVEPYVSIAISAQAQNIDACGEFVKLLMSDDYQHKLAMNDNLVLNREAFREAGKTAISFFNSKEGESYFGYDMNTGEPLSKKYNFTDATIDGLENIISSISMMYSSDASINLILVEEMPAYFSGQKDLNSVAAIAQDRAQKVLDERG